MSSIKIRNAITKLQDVFNDVNPHLSPADCAFVLDAITHYTVLCDTGEFDTSRQRVGWSKYNDRYGVSSIRGFAAEVMVVGLWNAQGVDTQFKLGDGEKTTEVKGCDVVAFNPKWNKQYVVQVKTTKNLDSEFIQVFDEWMGYNTNNVDRFVIADLIHRKALFLSYLQFLRCAHDYPNKLVPRAELLKSKNAIVLTQ